MNRLGIIVFLTVFVVGTLSTGGIPSADAALKLEISDGSSTITVVDGGALDANSSVGSVTFSGSLSSNFPVVVVNVVSKPVIGPGRLSFSGLVVGGGATITAKATDTDYTDPNPHPELQFGIGGTSNGPLNSSSFIGLSNMEFEMTTAGPSFGPFTGAFDGSGSDPIPDMGIPYSLTIQISVTHNSSTSTSWGSVLAVLPGGDEGFTPGFWKNHIDQWVGHATTDLIGSAFEIPAQLDSLASDTLLDALKYGGGGGIKGSAKNLLRSAVAALLNAAHPKVNYPLTVGGIKSKVNAALDSLNRGTMLALEGKLNALNNAGGDINAAPALRPDFQMPELQVAQIAVPRETRALANFPNPFNPETWIPFELAEATSVNIQIYDVRGRLIRTLALGHLAAGYYVDRAKTAYWDGRNDAGEHVASGLYLYRLTAGDYTAMRRMLILK